MEELPSAMQPRRSSSSPCSTFRRVQDACAQKEAPMYSFLDWFEAVRYRWRTVAAAVFLTVFVTLIYLAIAPKSYTATATLLVDQQQIEPVDEAKNGSTQSVIGTQADLVRSPYVASQAAMLAGLDRDPKYVEEWRS